MEAPMGICTQLSPGECLSDSDCSASGICEHPNPDMGPGTCAVIITHCSSDAECDWNQECEFSADGDFHENKPLSGICVEKELTHCSGDWDCADGEYCEFDDLGWSQFGCGEHQNSEMPMVNQGICIQEDIGFE